MNRADLQTLARERILDAEALLAGGRWAFAYDVAGYAVECGLKSCLTHDFERLIHLAGLQPELTARLNASKTFVGYWGVTTQWRVTDRYAPKSETEARDLYQAITDTPDGVLPWIMNCW